MLSCNCSLGDGRAMDLSDNLNECYHVFFGRLQSNGCHCAIMCSWEMADHGSPSAIMCSLEDCRAIDLPDILNVCYLATVSWEMVEQCILYVLQHML